MLVTRQERILAIDGVYIHVRFSSLLVITPKTYSQTNQPIDNALDEQSQSRLR